MASALDLLLSRQAAAAGVGIGTRRNRVLPAPTPTTDIPGRTGTADYALRKSVPVCVPEDLMSPLTETSYAARTYHADARQWANNGIYSFPLRPINRIAVTTGDGLLVTRYLCLAASDSVAGVRIAETDIIETGRTYSAESWSQRVYINGTFLQCGFDAKLTGINFSGKCGRPIALQISPTGSAATEHGSIFDNHVLYTPLITNHRIVELNAKTPTTNKKFQISLAAPGKFFERILDSAWTLLNSQTTPAPHAPFPWNRRLVGFGGLRCFVAYNGYIYTDQTKSTLLSSANRGLFVASTSFPPRYFKFTNNAEYVLPGTEWKFPGDACFPGIFCFPEPWYSSRINPFMLSSDKHLFKCAAGQVWRIKATITPGTGTAANDNYKIILEHRFDTILETSTAVNLQLAEINAKNWSAYPGNPFGAPTGGPTKRPLSYALISRPDGKEAYLIGYWYDNEVFPASAITRTITSLLRIVFAESGTSNPTTGVGVTADVTEVPVFAEMINTSAPYNGNTPESTTVDDHQVDSGMCGSSTMHLRTITTTYNAGIINQSNSGEQSYKKLIWVFVSAGGVFDFVYHHSSLVFDSSASGYTNGGSSVRTLTDYCIDPVTSSIGTDSDETGSLASAWSSESNQLWKIAIFSSVRGELVSIDLQGTLTRSVSLSSTAGGSGWTNNPGSNTYVHSGTMNGEAWSATLIEGYNPSSWSNSGTHYMLNGPTPIGSFSRGESFLNPTLAVVSGAAYHYVTMTVYREVDGVFDDFPVTVTSDDKIYHGYVFPLATPIQRVSIDARNGVTYVAESDTDIGHFF